MSEQPISLDNLIAFVRTIHDDAGPLDNLADAVRVAATLDEQSDALIGYFVDQARRSGAPWSEIGARMGVSKQAVQKRFVARIDESESLDQEKLFSRFTPRARKVVGAARRIASLSEAQGTDVEHLTAALLTEPEGIAALVIHGAGVSDEGLLAEFSLELPESPESPESPTTPAPPRGEVPFSTASKEALKASLMAALRLGHNYIGTEHILLGVVQSGGDVAERLESLGLTLPAVEAGVSAEFAKIQQQRNQG
jgi:ATP-dependent Clp protease ATP-binding subunit ClpA